MASNTSSLTTNFNIAPYFDDYDENKDFYRILFRPGLAVQTRELTQLQTIIQKQIDRFGENIFQNGSIVTGCAINYDQNYAYVRLRNNTSGGGSVNAASFLNKVITGAASGVTALVINTADGAEANTPNTKTVFVKYTNSGTSGTAKTFATNEIVTAPGGLSANTLASGATGFGSAISVSDGVIFAKDHFIRVAPQTLILNKYSSNTTLRVGFTVTESIIDELHDTSLLDNAAGSFNFAAPGAVRLKLTATLAALAVGTSSNNFIEILQTKNGVLQSLHDAPEYNVIRDYMAKRTYDTQGDMIVSGLDVRLREHLLTGNNNGVYTAGQGGDSTKLVADVQPGKSYVLGYDLETIATTHVPVDKATDSASIDTAVLAMVIGNSVDVDNVAGVFSVNDQSQVTLRSQQANADINLVYSGGALVGTQIGTARVRGIDYVSGVPGSAPAHYRLYLHDITMAAGKSFANVQSIAYSAGAGSANGKADIVGSNGTNAALSNPSQDAGLFLIPAQYIKTLRDSSGTIDNSWTFTKAFDGSFNSSGVFTINTGDASETIAGSGALGSTLARSRFYAVLKQSGNSALLTGTCNATSGSNNVICAATVSNALNVGDVVQITSILPLTVSAVSLGSFRTLQNASGTATSKNLYKKFYDGQVIDLGGVGLAGARTVTVTSTTTADVAIKETLNSPSSLNARIIAQLTKVNGHEANKVINRARLVQIKCANNTATTVGPWDLGFSDAFRITSVRKKSSAFTLTTDGTDVTSEFTLDNGQRDSLYSHAQLVKKATSTLAISSGDFLLVTLDYFSHSFSSGAGYFSVDSYPVNDATAGSDSTKIFTYQIPIYTSPKTGQTYSLRDVLDIRSRVTDTAADATTIGAMTTNPGTATTLVQPSGGLHYPWPNTNFNIDLQYYLPRKDVVSQTKAGQFIVTKGVPSLVPVVPNGPGDSMLLATVSLAPYPSLSPASAAQANRPDLACEVVAAKHPRFTMADIGSLQSRVSKLEYNTAMSALEKEAQAMLIPNSSGVDRFKNGLLVDSFVGHNIGNAGDPDYKIAVDAEEGEARPPAYLNTIELFYKAANSTNIVRTNTTTAGVARDQIVYIANSHVLYSNGESLTCGSATGTLRYQDRDRLVVEQATGNFNIGTSVVGGSTGTSSVARTGTGAATVPGPLLTLPYTHTPLVKQPYATTGRAITGLSYTWRGVLTLTPDTDYWFDTTVSPDVQVNFDSTNDNWLYNTAPWTTAWEAWETYWTGETEPVDWDSLGRIPNSSTDEVTAKKTWKQIRPLQGPESTSQSEGKNIRVINTNIQPFMRGKVIKFQATGLKPSTRVYPFFDNESVTSYVTPTDNTFTATGSEGANLTTDNTGAVYGLFRIPATASLRFRSGRKVFRLTDSSTNLSALGTVTTAAEAVYSSTGESATADGSIVSTRQPGLGGDSLLPTTTLQSVRPLSGSAQELATLQASDPLAQTFTVAGFQAGLVVGPGVYLTKVDLYFSAKDASAPVTIELREIDPTTKYLTPRILPFSQVTVPASSIAVKQQTVVIDDLGNTAVQSLPVPTTVYFPAPVFVANGREYGLVIRPAGGNPSYTMFTAALGQNDINTGQRVATQPSAGTLFIPTNDRSYQALQNEDLTFILYMAQFDTTVTGTAVVKNEPADTWTLPAGGAAYLKAGEAIHGETTLQLNSSLAVNTGITAVGQTSQANGVISFLSGTNMRVKGVTLTHKFQNGETIHFLQANGLIIKSGGVNVTRTLTSVVTPTAKVKKYDTTSTANVVLVVANVSFSNVGSISAGGAVFTPNMNIKGQTDGGTAVVGSINRFQGDTLQLMSDALVPANTSLTATVELATGSSTKDSTPFSIPFNEPYAPASTRWVLSRSLEANTSASSSTMAAVLSGEVILTFKTASIQGTPAVDVNRLALLTVENRINSNTAIGSSEDVVSSGGSALARYITRKVTLADGQDAEDIRVYFTAYKPSTANIGVYYKILNNADSDTFDQAKWIPMTQLTATTTFSDSTNPADTKDYSYGIPNYTNAYKSGANTTNSNTIEYRNSGGARYIGFKYFAVKIVLMNTVTVNPPRISDLRIVALQV